MNYTKEIKVKEPLEIEEPLLDLKLLRKKTNAKTPSGLMLKYAKQFKDNKNFLIAKLFEELYYQVKNMETSEKIRINSWRGKGGIKVWATPDKIIVEFAGKRDKDDKPKIQRKEYSKQEINKMIYYINKLKEEWGNRIPSRQLGEEYFGGSWDMNVFSKRSEHHKFTHLLNILDYYKIIKYNRGGFTSVIKEVREIQEVLK